MKRASLLLACLLLCAPMNAARALDLFGITLETSKRQELREAARGVGLELIREGGDDNWFDIYDSRLVLDGSLYCYLGFVKQSQQFAFVEYEFVGIDPRPMLVRLRGRYGEPQVVNGRYLTDKRYTWQRDGIEIALVSDWSANRVRLSYIHQENMTQYREERATYLATREQPVAEDTLLF